MRNVAIPSERRHADQALPEGPAGGIRTVVWLCGTLNQVGGGERVALEGAKYFTSRGIETHLVTWDFHPRALFDGAYTADTITVLAEPSLPGRSALARTLRRAATLRSLRRHLRQWRPDVVVCQSEYDCIVAWLVTRGLGIPFVVEIFGQMYQFDADFAKYTLAFRRHLKTIRDSKIGYRETISLQPPPLGLGARLVQEALAWARRTAVRAAACVTTLSRQVQWEVQQLYGRTSVVLKGAYGEDIFAHRTRTDPRSALGIKGDIILSVCRLVPKKRVDVLIRAFALLAKQRPDTVLLVGGTGPQADALMALAADLGLGDRVRFLGYVPENSLYDHVAAADLCVSIDIADFDIAGYEPLALGTRALWSSEHEVDDALRNHPLLFIADPNPDAVAAGMLRALSSPRPRTPEVLAPLKAYTWPARFARLHEAIEHTIGTRP